VSAVAALDRGHLRDADRVIERATRPQGMTCSLGGDPGGTCGLFLAGWQQRKLVLFRSWQAEQGGALELLGWVLSEHGYLIQAAGIEEFRSGPRSVRLHGTTAPATAGLVTDMTGLVTKAGIAAFVRPAVTVKKWADDRRLEKSGLLAATSGMPKHARDAARHALYTACHDLGFRDPLSRAGDREK
jgi:hypothetical protein